MASVQQKQVAASQCGAYGESDLENDEHEPEEERACCATEVSNGTTVAGNDEKTDS